MYTLFKYFNLKIFALPLLLTLALFLLNSNYGYNHWDEGYYWDGIQRTMAGEVPIRDFMAYDPGKYYFSAWLMKLWGDNGLVSLRLSLAVVQVIAVYSALYVLVNNTTKQNLLFIAASATLLLLWVRSYDQFLPVFLLINLTYLLSKPCVHRYFLLGVWVGFSAVIGRNHGVYGLVSSILAIIYLAIRSEESTPLFKAILVWSFGIIIGYLPILVMLVTVPNFASAFLDSIVLIFELKTTNLPLPIPWPWLFDLNQPLSSEALRAPILGFFILILIVFSLSGLVLSFYRKLTNKTNLPILVSSVFAAIPYTHYVYSRADIPHLFNSMPPLVVGCLVLLTMQPRFIKWIGVALVIGISVFEVLPTYTRFQCVGIGGKNCVEMTIGSDNMIVPKRVANDISFVRKLSEQYALSGQNFLVVPFWPGVYPALAHRNPMYELYALMPQSVHFQKMEIERLKTTDVAFVLIIDIMLDNNSQMLYQNTHPLIFNYINNNFDRLVPRRNDIPYDHQIYIKR